MLFPQVPVVYDYPFICKDIYHTVRQFECIDSRECNCHWVKWHWQIQLHIAKILHFINWQETLEGFIQNMIPDKYV